MVDDDINDLVVEVDNEPEPVTRKVQKLGRVDIPDIQLDAIGISVEDEVIVTYDDEENCVKIYDKVEMLSELL